MLTPTQIDDFKRDGVLVLRDFFTDEEVDRTRREISAHYRDPSSAAGWREALRSGFGKCDVKTAPTPESHARLAQVYGCLHASAHWEGENELVLRAGEEEPPWLGARAPHLDFPVAYPLRTLGNNVIYWTDVQARGGALMYWPGSHHAAWDYFRKYPDDYLAQGERSQEQIWPRLLDEIEFEPVEFLGSAGDMMIWHSLLMHSASRNLRPETRIATFGRWGVPPGDDFLYDFNQDMWSYWDFRPKSRFTSEAVAGGVKI